MQVSFKELKDIYDNEIKPNVKNKKKVFAFERNKIQYLYEAKRLLNNNLYDGGKYNVFLVYEPKIRVIMSQNVLDKLINHYVCRKILMPKLEKYLMDRNCATRVGMGTSYAINVFKKDLEKYKKKYNSEFYVLKLDIRKFFPSINHNVLLSLLENDLNEEEYNLIKKILSSTDASYINSKIKYLSKKIGKELPLYEKGKGLPIGNMTSQFLAIFYLNRLHHYMQSDLHLDFVAYMDDYVILSNDKDKLRDVLFKITNILENDYKLMVAKEKTFIKKITEGVNFLGYNFRIVGNKTIIKLSQNTRKNIKRRLRKNKYLYKKGLICEGQLFASLQNYKYSYNFVKDSTVLNIVNLYF